MNASHVPSVSALRDSMPSFPLELEREIFKLAFDPHDPLAITNRQLILVAKRVYNWFRPEFYRVMLQTRTPAGSDRGCYPNFRNCPDHIDQRQICGYARQVFIDYSLPDDEASTLLGMCTGIENLAFWPTNDTFVKEWCTISKFNSLRRLSGHFGSFTVRQLLEAPFALLLTHLEIMVPHECWQFDADILSRLPSLSHLALSPVFSDVQRLTRDIRSCDRIRVLVIYICDSTKYVELQQLHSVEPRMVLMAYSMHSYDSWLLGTRGGYDMWRWAESIIHARKHHYFNSDAYQRISFSVLFPWREYLTQEGVAWYEETVDSEKALTEDFQ